MIDFIILRVLNEKQKSEILELVAASREKEPVSISFPMNLENFKGSPDGYFLAYDGLRLVSALALLMVNEKICECVGFTHPAYRRRGLFAFMVEKAEGRLDAFPDMEITASADQRSEDAKGALTALGWDFWYTEYMMETELPVPLECPQTAHYEGLHTAWEKLNSEGEEELFIFRFIMNQEPIGSCNISVSGEDSYLFGLSIEEEYRSRGYGRYFLRKVLNILKDRNILRTKLQVSSENEPAVKLYQGMGFQVTEALDYYIW